MMEELLRESACLGNLDGVRKLLQSGTSVNSQNSVNGWTALHWATKRGHTAIVHLLLQSGADPAVRTHSGDLPIDVATASDIVQLLMDNSSPRPSDRETARVPDLPITPNYLANPPFPYCDIQEAGLNGAERSPVRQANGPPSTQLSADMKNLRLSDGPLEVGDLTVDSERSAEAVRKTLSSSPSSLPLVVRVRVSGSEEEDFVEAEVTSLTYHALLSACCQELEVGPSDVVKIRKLPNIWVRKDRDVQRMREGQELEIVLSNLEEYNRKN